MKELEQYYEVDIRFFKRGFSIISGSDDPILKVDEERLKVFYDKVYKLCEELELEGCEKV